MEVCVMITHANIYTFLIRLTPHLCTRVDTGMTAMIGGPPEVLEILSSGEIRIVTTVGSFPAADRTLPAPLAAAA
jgi:hypothetical protein